MPENNFYLELLNNQIKQLKEIIDNKKEYPEHLYNCVLAGILVQMNCVLESTLVYFHTDKFNEAACEIYKYRQFLVHYSDYRTFDNIEEISKSIIKKFEKVYPNERAYFKKILNYKPSKENNVLINKSRNIIYDEFTHSYVFKSEGMSLSVSADKVTVLKEFKRNKTIGYIVNCDMDMNYFTLDENYVPVYNQLHAPEELQDFFIKYFDVKGINFLEHKEMIKDILDDYYSGSFSRLRTYNVPENKRRKVLYDNTSDLLNQFFNNRIVYKDFLYKRRYETPGAPISKFEDFDLIKARAYDDLINNISERDYFFIKKSVSMFNDLQSEIRSEAFKLNEELQDKMLVSVYINFIDHSIRNLSNDFINSNESFKQLYIRLIDYRNFFAHNIYQLKPHLGERILKEFKDVTQGIMNILGSLNIEKITNPLLKNERSFLAIERPPKDFVNSKYEQYVKVDPTTYMGDKLYYASRGNNFNKIIGLIPNDKHGDYHGAFYDRKNNKFVVRTYQSHKSNVKKPLLVTKTNFEGGVDLMIDTNLSELLYINAALEGKCDEKEINISNKSKKKFLILAGGDRNNNQGHIIALDDVIMNYFQQRYLPYELARPLHHKIAINEVGKKYFELYDQDDNLLGAVVDQNTYRRLGIEKDPKTLFSVTDLTHVFERKEGNKL